MSADAAWLLAWGLLTLAWADPSPGTPRAWRMAAAAVSTLMTGATALRVGGGLGPGAWILFATGWFSSYRFWQTFRSALPGKSGAPPSGALLAVANAGVLQYTVHALWEFGGLVP